MTHQPTNSLRRQSAAPTIIARTARRAPDRADRLAARQKPRQSQLRGRRIAVLVLLSMALGFELSAAALTSPLFSIDRIAIRGAQPLRIDEALATEHASALPAGTNLFRAPLRQMESQVRSLPWIESANVRWTSAHSLIVQVKPRQAVVIAHMGGRSYEVDAKGVPIRAARDDVERKLPHIDVDRAINIRFGAAILDDALLAAINLHRDALRQPMVHIAKIRVDPEGNICLNMVDGIQVLLGQPEDLAEKMRYIQRVYELEPNAAGRMVAINLSYPKQPACTLKSDIQTNPDGATDGSSPGKPSSGPEVTL